MGGHGESQSTDLRAHEWQVAVDYRHLHADRFFFGSQATTPPQQFFGQPLFINVHSANINVTYAETDRFSVRLTVPVSYGSQSRFYQDSVRHVVRAGGIGDIGLVGNTWLLDPGTHARANFALGAGVKIPTGTNKFTADYFLKGGSSVQFPVDQAIELGDGGWGVILQGQAFGQVAPRTFAYFTGSYLVSPRDQTDVMRAPPGETNSTVHISVPDVYTGRLGLSYGLVPEQGLLVSVGGRVDGIPYHDLIGKNDGFRRPGYIIFMDPSVSLGRGRGTFTLSTPIRVAARLATASQSKLSGGTIGAGDLAGVLVFVGYARRF
ncbi:MAG: hypothetical protein DMD45_13425 [Gemmatimonadetes bacterium]|nr:MAG: hypothetical protein DMD45_13425 [Gemmatimonadota bacterium]